MKRLILATVLLAAGMTAEALADTQEKKFDVSAGQTLEIDLETGGSVTITGVHGNTVTVKTMPKGKDVQQLEVEVDRTKNGVRVESKYAGSRRNWSGGVDVEVSVPQRFNVDLETTGGGITIDGVEGRLEGSTMGGALNLKNLKGTVKLSTMGGSVALSSSEVDGAVSTMGGSVLFRDVKGDVKGSSTGGDVRYENVTRSDAGAVSKPVEISTMGGDIEIAAVDGGVTASTMGGDVEVTMVGDPASGERDVELESMGGNLTLRVPAELSMDIEIEIEFTKNSSRNYKIVTDFPLSTSESSDWSYKSGGARKLITGKGVVGGGKNKIRLTTTNGDVYLLRAK